MKTWRRLLILVLLTGACGGGGTTTKSDGGTSDGSMMTADARTTDGATVDARTPDATIQADAAVRPTITVGVAQTGTLPTSLFDNLVYEFTPTAAGMYTVTLMSTGPSSVQFATGPTPGGCFAGSDCCLVGPVVSSCNFKTLETLVAGTKYYLIISWQAGNGGQAFTLTVTGPS